MTIFMKNEFNKKIKKTICFQMDYGYDGKNIVESF